MEEETYYNKAKNYISNLPKVYLFVVIVILLFALIYIMSTCRDNPLELYSTISLPFDLPSNIFKKA